MASRERTADRQAQNPSEQGAFHSFSWQALGLLIPMGPVPPHAIDWSVFYTYEWGWLLLFLIDMVLFCGALESTYWYVRERVISLFWPLFLFPVSVALLLILLDSKRSGGVVVGPILLGVFLILGILVWLRLTVLAEWRPWFARRPGKSRNKRSR